MLHEETSRYEEGEEANKKKNNRLEIILNLPCSEVACRNLHLAIGYRLLWEEFMILSLFILFTFSCNFVLSLNKMCNKRRNLELKVAP